MSAPVTSWYPLFKHMCDEHGLPLTDGEMLEIAGKVDECRLWTTDNKLSDMQMRAVSVRPVNDLQKIEK